jgi:hypothetical protein
MIPGKKQYIIFTVLLFTMAGCVKQSVLDVTPIGSYTPATYWSNETDAVAGINGIYNILTDEEGVGHGIYGFEDASDDISVNGDHPDLWDIERLTPNSTSGQIVNSWPRLYEQIARANNAIIYVPKVPVMDENIRNRSLGEAYFLRAHAYWVLGLLFGEVPLIQEQNVLSGEYNIAKSTEDEVRTLIESELLKAADLLPETYSAADRGRVSKGAAWGMLSKLYLFWEKLDKAKEFGEKVISNSNYALAPKYADNFTTADQINNTELLFAVWNKNNVNSSPINIYFTNRAWSGWGFHHPTQNFAEEFEANDSRKSATLTSVGDSIPNQTSLSTIQDADAVQMFAGRAGQQTGRMLPSQSSTGYFIQKYTAYDPLNPGSLDGDLKQPILRTADIYLVVAEAKIRTGAAGSGDVEINAVRNRAGLPSINGAGINQLIHERRVELGGENIRWFDLLRWDKKGIINIQDIVGKPKKASPLTPYNGATVVAARTFTKPKNYYLPIPQNVIDQSKGVIKQNPNY